MCLDRTETRLLVSSERGPVFLFDLLETPALQGPALASVPAVKAYGQLRASSEETLT